MLYVQASSVHHIIWPHNKVATLCCSSYFQFAEIPHDRLKIKMPQRHTRIRTKDYQLFKLLTSHAKPVATNLKLPSSASAKPFMLKVCVVASS